MERKENMGKNKVIFEITNCCSCPYHYKEQIYTADSWEHELGVYCSKVVDKNSYNHQHKLVCADDWNVEKYADIPNWCPLLKK